MIHIDCEPFYSSSTYKVLRFRIRNGKEDLRIERTLQNDWLESEFDLVFEHCKRVLKEEMRKERELAATSDVA